MDAQPDSSSPDPTEPAVGAVSLDGAREPLRRETLRDDEPVGRETLRDDEPVGRETLRDDEPEAEAADPERESAARREAGGDPTQRANDARRVTEALAPSPEPSEEEPDLRETREAPPAPAGVLSPAAGRDSPSWNDPRETREAPLTARRRRSRGRPPATEARSSGRRAAIPRRLGRYEIRGELGRGGVGVVYAAWDPKLEREVALKTLLAGSDASDVVVERFLREVRAASRLRHPHIVSVHDAGVVSGRFYLAMDRIEGRSLANLLDAEGALEPRRAVQLLAPVARALAHAHSEGFLHRDVKPENVLIDTDGTPYLTDFGLAADLKETDRLTQSHQALGTPAFMAPEQLRGRHRDPRVDVYALGATLYECVTGRVPFEAESYAELMHKVLTREPSPPRALAPRLAPDLEAVILTCLEKEPDRRYPGPADLAADLERFLRGEAVRARLPGLFRRLWQRAQRHRALALGTSVALTGILAGSFGAFWIYRDASRESRRTGRLEEERGRLLATQRERSAREEARSAASAEAALAASTEDAIAAFTRLLDRYPESWEGRVARARLHRQRSRELRARDRDPSAALAAAALALEDLDQALREADRGALRLLKAELLRVELRRPAEALSEFQTVLEHAPEPALRSYAEARIAFAQGDLPRAERAARAALERLSLGPARLLLAEIFLQSGRPSQAIEELDALAGRPENEAEVVLLRGLALWRLEAYRDAESDALRARELNPLDPRAHLLLAELRLERGNLGGAKAATEAAIALEPEAGDHRLLLARVCLKLGHARGAQAAYQAALQSARPPSPEACAALKAEATALGLWAPTPAPTPAPAPTPTPGPGG